MEITPIYSSDKSDVIIINDDNCTENCTKSNRANITSRNCFASVCLPFISDEIEVEPIFNNNHQNVDNDNGEKIIFEGKDISISIINNKSNRSPYEKSEHFNQGFENGRDDNDDADDVILIEDDNDIILIEDDNDDDQSCYKNGHLNDIVQVNKVSQCLLCNKKLSSKYSLQRHMVIHTGERPFGCDICSKRFQQFFDLKKHRRIHISNQYGFKSMTCSMNPSTLVNTTKTELCENNHNHQYTVERDVTDCNQLSSNISVLTTSYQSDEENKYSCTKCHKVFASQSNLKQHLIIHTDEKQFERNICQKQFQEMSNHEHLVTQFHENQFETHNYNIDHKVIKSKISKKHCVSKNKKLYECPHCVKKFKSLTACKSHLRFVHSNKQI